MVNSVRLLLVASSNRRRGAEVFTENLQQGLLAHGWTVESVSLTNSRDAATSSLEPLTDLDPKELGRLSPTVLLALVRRIVRFKPHVILAGGGATLRYGVLATMASSTKLAYIGIGEPEYWLRSNISRLFNRWLLRRTDLILAVSQMTAAQISRIEPSVAGRVHYGPTGVPDEFFDVATDDRRNGPLRVVMIGSLSREKDPATALRSVALLPCALLRFVGDGPLRAEMAQMTSDLGVSDRVQFAGSTEDVKPHLQWADVIVLTSLTEGLPGVILEAGAAGLPAVAVDVGGVSEAIKDGVTGVIVDRDVGDVARALESLSADRRRLDRMGKEAKSYVSASYNMGAALDRYVSTLRGILE